MRKKLIRIGLIIIIILLISIRGIASTKSIDNRAMNELLYHPKYEFRSAWIATVYNLDWPSKPGLGIKEQKEEYTDLLDNLKGAGINAVVVQVRPCGDAFYSSKYAPWSEYLTGIQGKYPGYNPLKFMIEETHKRGMEFHAWMNPFRITTSGLDQTQLDKHNIAYLQPDWLIAYDNKWMLNPGIPQVREYIIDMVAELILEYPIDGIHFDDYFYPYLNPKEGEFPDEKTYRNYNIKHLSKEEWRRNNINELVKGISEIIKLNNPKIKFGISPFGIWCNKSSNRYGSDTKAGVSSYETLYADTRQWVK
ncbi:glycoside hydrolase family 10 protein, partial [Clostridium sp.]|uniref:glycoside hydrolase family 10 protein n=1 Tax=Clostridium sp. TaxID=1506 RepID=UPI003F3CB479